MESSFTCPIWSTQYAFHPPVWDEPGHGDRDIERNRKRRENRSDRDSENVGDEREVAFTVSADGERDSRVRSVGCDEGVREDPEGDPRAEKHHTVDGDGSAVPEVRAEPLRRDRRQGEPEKKVRVRPEGRAADVVDELQKVVVVIPVDRQKDEAEGIDRELR